MKCSSHAGCGRNPQRWKMEYPVPNRTVSSSSSTNAPVAGSVIFDNRCGAASTSSKPSSPFRSAAQAMLSGPGGCVSRSYSSSVPGNHRRCRRRRPVLRRQTSRLSPRLWYGSLVLFEHLETQLGPGAELSVEDVLPQLKIDPFVQCPQLIQGSLDRKRGSEYIAFPAFTSSPYCIVLIAWGPRDFESGQQCRKISRGGVDVGGQADVFQQLPTSRAMGETGGGLQVPTSDLRHGFGVGAGEREDAAVRDRRTAGLPPPQHHRPPRGGTAGGRTSMTWRGVEPAAGAGDRGWRRSANNCCRYGRPGGRATELGRLRRFPLARYASSGRAARNRRSPARRVDLQAQFQVSGAMTAVACSPGGLRLLAT